MQSSHIGLLLLGVGALLMIANFMLVSTSSEAGRRERSVGLLAARGILMIARLVPDHQDLWSTWKEVSPAILFLAISLPSVISAVTSRSRPWG